MNIAHELWEGSGLQLQSKFKNELDMMSEVRKYVETMSKLPDLTEEEHSYLQALEQWLDERNREYE